MDEAGLIEGLGSIDANPLDLTDLNLIKHFRECKNISKMDL